VSFLPVLSSANFSRHSGLCCIEFVCRSVGVRERVGAGIIISIDIVVDPYDLRGHELMRSSGRGGEGI
jgi:hypothetical protein